MYRCLIHSIVVFVERSYENSKWSALGTELPFSYTQQDGAKRREADVHCANFLIGMYGYFTQGTPTGAR